MKFECKWTGGVTIILKAFKLWELDEREFCIVNIKAFIIPHNYYEDQLHGKDYVYPASIY
jgi:hypothetical protein